MDFNSKYKSSEIEGILDSVGGKQDKLISGENIKTINGESILGEGDLKIDIDTSEIEAKLEVMQDAISDLETIRSGAAKGATAIQEVKTINGQSIVGEGDITIAGGEKGDKGDKGDQGNSGYTGAADELEVVNNLTQGGATAALSAEMGKVLDENARTWNGAIVAEYINLLESWDLTGSTGYTNYIAAKPNTLYSFYDYKPALWKPIAILEYDADKKQIKSTAASSITTGTTTAFIRVNEYKSVTGRKMVIEGDYVPDKYLSHEESRTLVMDNKIFNDGISEFVSNQIFPKTIFDGKNVALDTIPINANDWIGITRNNIVDNSTNLPQTNINATTGETMSYEYMDCSDFIPVRSGKKYFILQGVSMVCFYDKDKKYIKVSTNKFGNYVTIPNDVAFIRCTITANKDAIISESDDFVDLSKENTLRFWQNKDEFFDNMVENLANVGSKVLVGRPYNLLQYQMEGTETNGVFSAFANTTKYISNKIKGEKSEYTFTEERPYYIDILEFEVLRYDAEDTFLGKQTYKGVRGFTLTEDCEYFRMKINNNWSCLIRGGVEDVQGRRDKDTLSIEFRNDDYRKQIMSDVLKYPQADKLLLNTMFPQLFGKKYVALGDSLTNGTGSIPYCQVAAEYFGMNLINYGIISSTLAEYDEAGGGYEPMSVRYADMDADADVVTIMGGTNDVYSKIGTMSDRQENGQFTLYSGAHKLFKGIMEKYPNAKVGVILPPQFAKCLPTDTEGNGPDINLEKHQARLAAIKEVAEFYSLPVLDLCHHGGINGYGTVQRELFFQADKLHLTTAGQARLAEKVIAWMKTL